MTRLVIAEKPSVAHALAAVLGARKRENGYLSGEGWLVSWCLGHLVELVSADAYGEQYTRWKIEDLPILPEQWQYRATASKTKQLEVLQSLLKHPDVESIVCATDAGREGELIFRLVYAHCGCTKPVERLWISSLEERAIREGFHHLRPASAFDNLYRSALCRAQADWLIGINATRLFSCLYGATLHVGRVQSPTLALLVAREQALRGFSSEPFYVPEISLGEDGSPFTASGERIDDASEAEAFRAACDGREAVCLSVERQKQSVVPPKLYDLTTLQREANRLYGYTAQQTLDYAQSLYEKKLISYPRSDSRYLSSDMTEGIPQLIGRAAAAFSFLAEAELSINAEQLCDDSKVSDHHAIVPTLDIGRTDLGALPSGERDLLALIVTRLICAAGEKQELEALTAVFECVGHRYTYKGKRSLHSGWKAVEEAFRLALQSKIKEDDEETGDEARWPELNEGEVFAAARATVRKGKTTPPRRYTEDSLLAAMETAGAEDMPEEAERKGLGTPATCASIIEKLIKTAFVERKGKQLLPTPKGEQLIAILPETLTSAQLTAEWEQKLKQVERGEMSETDFMKGIHRMTTDLVAKHSASEGGARTHFAAPPVGSKRPSGVIVGVCPRCGKSVLEGIKGFFCEDRACGFVLWRENRFFSAKRKTLTKRVAITLLKDGHIFMADLYSERTGKTYAATIVMVDEGGTVRFRLEFEAGEKPKMR